MRRNVPSREIAATLFMSIDAWGQMCGWASALLRMAILFIFIVPIPCLVGAVVMRAIVVIAMVFLMVIAAMAFWTRAVATAAA